MTQQNTQQGIKYARICSITGQGMWQGWVFNEGNEYAKDEESANKLAQNLGYKDYKEAYEDGACYWTDWSEDEKENTQYIEINGIMHDYWGEDISGSPVYW
jgi:hypothetical protein